MNDWERIRASLEADEALIDARKNEIWRWTALAREWLDEQGVDVTTVVRGDMLRYVSEVEPTSGPKNPQQRLWAFKHLVEAARSVTPARARRTDTAVARLDAVPGRSPLGKAIARVFARARSDGDRTRWATCLGAFLLWCDRVGRPATECWPGDLGVFRADRLEAGYRSPGEYVRVARMLLEELAEAP